MYGRLARCLALSLLLPVYLAGCTSSDDSEYRAYTPADNQYTSTLPDDVGTGAQPDPEPAAVSESAQDGNLAQATEETTDARDDQSATGAEVGTTDPDAADSATTSPLGNAALTPEQQADLLAIASAAPETAAASEPRETKLLVPEKSFKVEGQALRVVYDDLDLLKVLNMDPVTIDAPEHFPSWLRDLEGQRIRLRGFMRPGVVSEDLPMFVLARDTNACCFGPNTKAYDIIPVILQEGTTTDYIHLRPFDIVGVFHIMVEPDLDDPNKVQFLYYIDGAELIEK